jgi:hypothetical protein
MAMSRQQDKRIGHGRSMLIDYARSNQARTSTTARCTQHQVGFHRSLTVMVRSEHRRVSASFYPSPGLASDG